MWSAGVCRAHCRGVSRGRSHEVRVAGLGDEVQCLGLPGLVPVVVGLLEVVCSILLLVPRTRRWAALVLTTLMLGAAGTHVLHGEAPRIVVNIVLAALLVAALTLTRRSDGSSRP